MSTPAPPPPPAGRLNERTLPPGKTTCIDCTPSHGFSVGSRLNVPLEVTRTALQPPNHCSYCFWYTFMWRHPPPIGSKRSPYSPCVQVDRSSENQPFEHTIDDEWFMP